MSRCTQCCQENCETYYNQCACYCHHEPAVRVAAAIGLTGRRVCNKHRRYQAKRRPLKACEACWRAYIKAHP